MYATGSLSTCQCTCGGSTHGLMAEYPVHIDCTPYVAVRCKNGQEGGVCHCACGGKNHGLYHTIEGFEGIRITGLTI